MPKQTRLPSELGDVAQGLFLETLDPSRSSQFVQAQVAIVPGYLAFIQIPASSLRQTFESLAPSLAKNLDADSVSGLYHRYKAGHDLLLDVSRTAYEKGTWAGAQQAGHILLTDFGTKAGIPIPGFSRDALGGYLESLGVHPRWLQVNLFDSTFGILALTDGYSNLSAALAGGLALTPTTAFNTFGAGALELGVAVHSGNPLLIAGGLENIAAGLVATYKEFSVYVAPLSVLGPAVFSFALGFALSKVALSNTTQAALADGLKGALISAMFAIYPAFGFGCIAGSLLARGASSLATFHEEDRRRSLIVSETLYSLLRESYAKGDPNWESFKEYAHVPAETLALIELTKQHLLSAAEYQSVFRDSEKTWSLFDSPNKPDFFNQTLNGQHHSLFTQRSS